MSCRSCAILLPQFRHFLKPARSLHIPPGGKTVKCHDPEWTIAVLEDLQKFFESNDMELSAAAVTKAALVVAGEIKEKVPIVLELYRNDTR